MKSLMMPLVLATGVASVLTIAFLLTRFCHYCRQATQSQTNPYHCESCQQIANRGGDQTDNLNKATRHQQDVSEIYSQLCPICAFITNRDDLQVIFNGLLMVFTSVLSVIAVRQWRAFRNLERGVVIVDDFATVNLEPTSTLEPGLSTSVFFRFRNIGRTAVRFVDSKVRCHLATHLTEPPDYGARRLLLTGQMIPKDEHLYRFALLEDDRIPNGRIPDATFEMIIASVDIFMVIYGYVRYRDVFGKLHITGFCRQYSPLAHRIGDRSQFQVYGSEAYNYSN